MLVPVPPHPLELVYLKLVKEPLKVPGEVVLTQVDLLLEEFEPGELPSKTLAE